MRQHLVPPLSIFALCLLAAAPAWTAEVEVTVDNFFFFPAEVDIQAGDTVVWTLDSGSHSVTADDGSFLSGGFPFFQTFNSSGSFAYHCGVHPFMQGTVNVAAAPSETCVPSSTVLCLHGDRFKLELKWRNATSPLTPATAVALPFAPSSGLFYFAGADNIEMLVKVLNACVPVLGNKYWVFFAATTNLEFELTVIDTSAGATKVYTNPLNRPALPVQDTNAFATCP
ncbi:MAG TPA: hypothetical protein VE078_20620 [Thermoanaerobaculia bacterium]|nr:hypothetical protein [Thermoanaerobaculia bacterium]